MAIARVESWLSQPRPDYKEGLALFLEHTKDPQGALAVVLKTGENSFTRQKLREQLRAIAGHNLKPFREASEKRSHKPPPSSPKPETPPPATSKQQDIKMPAITPKKRHALGITHGYPPHLVELDRQTQFDMKELEALTRESIQIPEGHELYEHAKKRVLLDRKIADAYAQLNHFAQKLQVLPGTEPEDDMERAARLMRALKRNRPYISKNKNSEDPEIQAKVKSYQDELEEAELFMQNHSR